MPHSQRTAEQNTRLATIIAVAHVPEHTLLSHRMGHMAVS